jgi:hypothetical protein
MNPDGHSNTAKTRIAFHRHPTGLIAPQFRYGLPSLAVLSALLTAGILAYLSYQTQTRGLEITQHVSRDLAAQALAQQKVVEHQTGDYLLLPVKQLNGEQPWTDPAQRDMESRL